MHNKSNNNLYGNCIEQKRQFQYTGECNERQQDNCFERKLWSNLNVVADDDNVNEK